MEQPDKEQPDNDATAESSGDDLSKLLDSCLDDFNKPLPIPPPASAQSKKVSTSEAKSSSSDSAKPPESAAWGEEFKEFSEVMENFITDESELNEIKKLMSSCLSQEGPPIDDENFAKSFADTIQELTQQAQNIPETSPEDLANLLSGLGMGGDGNNPDMENLPEIMPLMQSVMQRLMSKELLYPSIKEIVEKYPGWLNEQKSTLKTEEYDNYQKQFEIMKEICDEFEKEIAPSESARKEQFEKVLQLMQKVQSYGNPPKELVSTINPGIPVDGEGNLQIPGMTEQCVIM
ncbi:peroxisomal biogenesis factor 19 [Trichonephila clavata]|uniref:Peroxin-19 n=1 Tax=Trichonephila clavata TaxID=2740835 RepID=A0A8X6LKW2_TRICU|nr:peroxisomal biogenesis factor 19 [Trichonephila clavata]